MLSKIIILVATVQTGAHHLPPCACLAGAFGFSIDCSGHDKIQESYDAAMAACNSNCSSEPCQKNLAMVEAHDDSCSSEDMPSEVSLHDLEKSCGQLCTNELSDQTACPRTNCARSILDTLQDSDCTSDCSAGECREAYRTLRFLHEECHDDHADGSEGEDFKDLSSEIHRYEAACELSSHSSASDWTFWVIFGVDPTPLQSVRWKVAIHVMMGVAIVAFFSCILLCVKRIHKTRYSKEALRNLPKAIPLTPEHLDAHVVNMKPLSELANLQSRKLAGTMSEWTKYDFAYACEGKASISIYDSPEADAKKYIVIMMKRCAQGPPLLPMKRDGSVDWIQFEGEFSLATYLNKFLWALRDDDGESLILQDLNTQTLVWYQAAITEENWRDVWDTLLKPFTEQRCAYRRMNKTKHAPEIFFGVEAKFVASGTTSTDSSRSRLPSHITADDEATLGVEVEIPEHTGIQIPTAAQWIEFWGRRQIPQERTFIHFANELSSASFPRRSNSCSDIPKLDVDDYSIIRL